MEIIQEIFRGDSPWSLPVFLVLAGLLTSLLKAALNFISVRLRRFTMQTTTHWDDVFVDVLDGLRWVVLYIWIFYVMVHSFIPLQRGSKALQILLVVLTGYQFAVWGFYIIRNWRDTYLEEKMGKDASSASVLGLMYAGVQAVFLTILVLMSLSNLGIDIGALIAGLGVGGIAVALAAQNILGDLFASLSIVLDKPFVIGDSIKVGEDVGVVERIGIKSTRVTSLSGEELIFSNKMLLDHRIRNFKRLVHRRVVQNFGLTYSTSPDVVERIPVWIQEFFETKPDLKFDRCHFKNFGASSLDFELVFFVTNPDYNLYMDLQQQLLLHIMRKFQAEKVDFAFPTQSLYIEKINMGATT